MSVNRYDTVIIFNVYSITPDKHIKNIQQIEIDFTLRYEISVITRIGLIINMVEENPETNGLSVSARINSDRLGLGDYFQEHYYEVLIT